MTSLFDSWRAVAAALPFSLALSGAADAADPKQESRNFATHPPRVDKTIARLLPNPLPAGNALIEVTIARDEKLPPQIPIQLDKSTALLRDDGKEGDRVAGDRVYSAIVPLDVKALEREQQRVRALQDRHGRLTMPIYQGRRLVQRLVLPDSFFNPIRHGEPFPLDWWGFSVALDPAKTLLIRDPAVVEDPTRTYDPCTGTGTSMGKWTFGYLLANIANPVFTMISTEAFAFQWMQEMTTTQSANGWSVPPHAMTLEAFNSWPRKFMSKELDVAKAPFRLLAIVNRVDLRDNTAYGGTNAGEVRFVFGYYGCPGTAAPGTFPRFTVILEYGIRKPGCMSLKNWAQQWAALNDLPLGSPAYNAALEAITDQFSLADAAPTRPNRSALNQLRTNRGASSSVWELREFRLVGHGPVATHLDLTTVAQTPSSDVMPEYVGGAVVYPNPTALADYVNGSTGSILAGEHVVPPTFAGHPFLGGASTRHGVQFDWNSPDIVNREARHKFALATCNGCHHGENGTDKSPEEFFHIAPAPPGSTAALSGFMTGIDAPDFFDGMPVRHFNELERRATDLDGLANNVCLKAVDTKLGKQIPLKMTH